ncbi:membrane protein [Asticcacaulis sp. AC460]|uniref:membrane protein n=1 Tax=Asticcacaulis sp. AC460 TaxID=1282360 RepID=UPI0004CF9FE6|nr:membrane protein [Asticcacaulis sp. AC460]
MTTASPNARYMIGMSFWMVLYAAALIGSILLIKSLQPTGPLLYVLAVAPALPIGGTIIVFLRYIDAVDEYVRAITTRRFVIATGLTLFLCTAWGFLENNAGAHEFSLYLVYPLFWGLYGATSIFVRQAS